MASLLQTSLYLGEDGKPMLVYDAPSIAGAPYYPTAVECPDLTSYTPGEDEAYEWLFELADKVDGAYATAYGHILRITFEDDPDYFAEVLSRRDSETRQKITTALMYAYAGEEATLSQLCAEIKNKEIKAAILSGLK